MIDRMMKLLVYTSTIFLMFGVFAQQHNATNKRQNKQDYAVAYFASGCFWCVEAVFESVEGVKEAVSGYSGGKASDANYQDVSAGRTNHAETVAIYYDPKVVDYQKLLVVFFDSHDPTTLNQQGPDRGRHYRSAIFYQTDEERQLAENYVKTLLKKGQFSKITTEITAFTGFYEAEEYHQNFKLRNPNHPYIKRVSDPRLQQFKRKHPDLLRK